MERGVEADTDAYQRHAGDRRNRQCSAVVCCTDRATVTAFCLLAGSIYRQRATPDQVRQALKRRGFRGACKLLRDAVQHIELV